MYYLYILLLSNGDLYKGTTSNLKRRTKEHQLGKVKSTRNKRPLRLIYYGAYLLKSDAERRENFLKTTEGRRLLKQQLKDILKGSPGHPTGRPAIRQAEWRDDSPHPLKIKSRCNHQRLFIPVLYLSYGFFQCFACFKFRNFHRWNF